MLYNARKHNKVIRALLNGMGFGHDVTYTDKRKYGRRVSFVPDYWAVIHKHRNTATFPNDVQEKMLYSINAFLKMHNITNVEPYFERCYTWHPRVKYDRFNLRVFL